MRTIEIEGQLRERLFQELGDPGQVFLDGQIHRFKGDGDKSQNAWYVCHPEGYGAFGSWRLGYTAKFKADGINTRSNEMRDLMERRAFEAAIEKNRKRAAAKERAIEMWRQSKDVDSNHPYIQAKFNGELPPKLSCTQLGATLLIPMFDLEEETGVVANLQRIDQTGQKKFLYGGTSDWDRTQDDAQCSPSSTSDQHLRGMGNRSDAVQLWTQRSYRLEHRQPWNCCQDYPQARTWEDYLYRR